MKKCFACIGKSLCYFGLYLFAQTIITVVYTSLLSIYLFAANIIPLDTPSIEIESMLLTSLGEHLMTITVIANLSTLFCFWLFFIIRKKKFSKEICLHRIPNNLYLPLTVLAFGLNLFTITAMSLLPIPTTIMDEYTASSGLLFTGNIFISIFAVVIVAPIFEEILFRGLIYRRLKAGMPIWVAAILSSLVFGVIHGHIIWVVYATLLALVFVYLFELTGSLATCIFTHFVFNFSGLLFTFIPGDSVLLIWILLILSMGVIFFSHNMLKQKLLIKSTS